VDSNDPGSPVVIVAMQGEGTCEEDPAPLQHYELEVSADIKFATEFNPTFLGTGRIPLEIHSCIFSFPNTREVQVTGEGVLDLTYHAAGAGCTQNGQWPLGATISPSGLGVGTSDLIFIKLDLALSVFEAEQCCEDSGCGPVSVPVPAFRLETEIAFHDGATVTKQYSVDVMNASFTFTLHIVQ
jgi:hypothetical protein